MATAQGINDDGQVVGLMTDDTFLFHAFVWHEGALATLPPLADEDEAAAFDINGSGQAVGWSRTSGGADVAVMWTGEKSASQMVSDLIALVESYDLGKLGTSLTDKLTTVDRMLAARKPKQAIESLEAFVKQVEVQSGKALIEDQATELICAAGEIEEAIG